jgi:hypothetical protein
MKLLLALSLLACAKTEPVTPPPSPAAVEAGPALQEPAPVEPDPTEPDPVELAAQARARLAANAADPQANYQLALALAELRTRAAPCEHGASLGAILEHLVLAVQQDPANRALMRQEGRFEALHSSLRYRLLDQGGAGGARDLQAVFSGLVLWGPAAGVWGSSGSLTLRPDGSVAVVKRVLGEGGMVEQVEPDGSWSAAGGPLKLTIGGETQELRIGESGALRDASGPRWYDVPSECGA